MVQLRQRFLITPEDTGLTPVSGNNIEHLFTLNYREKIKTLGNCL